MRERSDVNVSGGGLPANDHAESGPEGRGTEMTRQNPPARARREAKTIVTTVVSARPRAGGPAAVHSAGKNRLEKAGGGRLHTYTDV